MSADHVWTLVGKRYHAFDAKPASGAALRRAGLCGQARGPVGFEVVLGQTRSAENTCKNCIRAVERRRFAQLAERGEGRVPPESALRPGVSDSGVTAASFRRSEEELSALDKSQIWDLIIDWKTDIRQRKAWSFDDLALALDRYGFEIRRKPRE